MNLFYFLHKQTHFHTTKSESVILNWVNRYYHANNDINFGIWWYEMKMNEMQINSEILICNGSWLQTF